MCCVGPETGLARIIQRTLLVLCFCAVQVTSAEDMGARLREVHHFTGVSAPYSIQWALDTGQIHTENPDTIPDHWNG